MLDIGAALFSAALRVVEGLVSKWINKKVSVVRVSDVDKQMAQLAKEEADKLRLRVSDLEAESKRVWTLILNKMPELEVTQKPLGAKSIKLIYNPEADYSGAQLLANLKKRVQEIEKEQGAPLNPEALVKSTSEPEDLFVPAEQTVSFSDPISCDGENNRPGTLSSKMLQELQKRVIEKENPRT